jgi:hypothetical protein
MPPRRTSPRRSATRPSVPLAQYASDDSYDEPGRLAAAAPWLAIAAVALAGVALAVSFLGRGGGTNLDACRKAAWAAVPSSNDLPDGWTLSATDLNANGMTVSVLGTPSTDGSTSTPVVYASVTCYGDVAATAMSQYRDAAKAAGATVTDRGLGGDAYDVDNPSSGSVTTLFRVGGLIGQVADAGSASPTELATITSAVAAAMGDRSAAGTSGGQASASRVPASDEPTLDPNASDVPAASEAPTAPELEAHMPTDAGGTPLTVVSGIATDFLPHDPSGGALIAALRQDGIGAADLQVAQAYDDSQSVDLSVFGFRLTKGDVAKLRAAVVNSWLSGSAPGVKQTSVKLGTKTFTKIDYGTDHFDWVYTGTDYVIVIETSDATLAAEVAGSVE